MKTHHYLLLLTLSIAACSKRDSIPLTPAAPIIHYKDTAAALPFITTSLAADHLKFTFPWPANIAKVYLKEDTTTLGTFTTTPAPYFYSYADISYPFESGKTYSFVLETAPVNNIANRYTLRNYSHIYASSFTEQKLLPLTQSMGPNEMDISPSRKTLFIDDDIQNVVVTKKLSLTDGSVTNIGTFNYGLLRALSDDEIVVFADSAGGHPLYHDSAALIRYNIATKQSRFIAYVNPNSYTSRIIGNHILISSATSQVQLVNLADTTKRSYPYPDVNPVGIGQYNFDHLYYGNQLVNPTTGAFTPVIPAGDSTGIEVFDSATGYVFASWISALTPLTDYPPAALSYAHLSVYKNGSKVYQSQDATVSYQIPRQPLIANNRLIFHQDFGFDTTWHVSGYYQLDLNTKTTTLLHCYSTPYVMEEFQLDPHTIISVRQDGVYRVTIP